MTVSETSIAILAEVVANAVCRDVCELPDRASPDDQPMMLSVTADELHAIVAGRFERALSQLHDLTLAKLSEARGQ